jgi:hypothetical protein
MDAARPTLSLPATPRSSLISLDLDDPRWSAFVASRPEALPYHHPAWAALLAETYGYRGFALALADTGDRLCAGLPFLEVGGHTGRPRWVALPFTDVCPVLGDVDAVDTFTGELALERERRALSRI